jgi:hypothetical protein
MKNLLIALFLAFAFAGLPAHAKETPSSLSLLSDAEKSYYEQIFGYSMDNLAGGQRYTWKSYSGFGSIVVEDVFISKSGYPCRGYAETYNVQNQEGAYRGIACKRQGKEGWCKLKPGNAKTCAMEDRRFMFSMPSMPVGSVGIGEVGAPPQSSGVSSPDFPTVNTRVDMPQTSSEAPTGKSYSDTITGNAGKAAGNAAASGISWFSDTFGR